MSSPFDWRGKAPQLDWQRQDRAGKLSRLVSAAVDKKRAEGKEPAPQTEGGAVRAGDPRKYVVEGGR